MGVGTDQFRVKTIKNQFQELQTRAHDLQTRACNVLSNSGASGQVKLEPRISKLEPATVDKANSSLLVGKLEPAVFFSISATLFSVQLRATSDNSMISPKPEIGLR